MKKPHGFWKLEACIIDAKLYKYRTDWKMGSPSGYSVATQKGWVDLCCVHMPKRRGIKS